MTRTTDTATIEENRQETAYELGVSRDLVAQHYLTVPDPGPEGEIHSHHFELEIRFAGSSLDEYGYLVDIDAVNDVLDDIEDRYRDTLLNDLPEFEGENPSVERFARHVGDRIDAALHDGAPESLVVRIWEDESAWASHRRRLE
ncbi:MAG: 6-pyruvoyl trahydropterin synthase family protein [Halanaeroarchaeum sp.]